MDVRNRENMGGNVVCLGQSGIDVSVKTREEETLSDQPITAPRQ